MVAVVQSHLGGGQDTIIYPYISEKKHVFYGVSLYFELRCHFFVSPGYIISHERIFNVQCYAYHA